MEAQKMKEAGGEPCVREEVEVGAGRRCGGVLLVAGGAASWPKAEGTGIERKKRRGL